MIMPARTFGLRGRVSSAVGPTPTFVAASTLVVGASSIDVPYYSGLAANDIAWIYALGAITEPGTISGWTALSTFNHDTVYYERLYWKRLAGSESGTVTVTGGSSSLYSYMVGIRGCLASGTPYEGYNTASGTSTSETSTTITTTGSNRLGMRFGEHGDGDATTAPSGWTEQVDGTGITFDTKTIASATTEAASTRTFGTSQVFGVLTLAALPT